ncbi:major antigen protein [Colletotrichum tofieldiae]|nr:major antigen protein [Colletotrichum tofieldiae]
MFSNGNESAMSSENKDLEDYEMVFTANDVQKAVDQAVAAAIEKTNSEAMKKMAMVQNDLNKQVAKLKASEQSNKVNLIKCEEDLEICHAQVKDLNKQVAKLKDSEKSNKANLIKYKEDLEDYEGIVTKLEKKLAAAKASKKALQGQLDAIRDELRIARGGCIGGDWW